tara:strand:+ start:378 stop:527 length:150 start_codon:yes stop_codon:yes gene_type:complete
MKNKEHEEWLKYFVNSVKGEMTEYSTLDSGGRSSKKIVIEYDIKRENKG